MHPTLQRGRATAWPAAPRPAASASQDASFRIPPCAPSAPPAAHAQAQQPSRRPASLAGLQRRRGRQHALPALQTATKPRLGGLGASSAPQTRMPTLKGPVGELLVQWNFVSCCIVLCCGTLQLHSGGLHGRGAGMFSAAPSLSPPAAACLALPCVWCEVSSGCQQQCEVAVSS